MEKSPRPERSRAAAQSKDRGRDPAASRVKVQVADLADLVGRCLRRAGASPRTAAAIARIVVAAERDGSLSHGLQRVPGYLSSLASGWVDGRARPSLSRPAPGLLQADGGNGFAQIALAKADRPLRRAAERNGVALLGIRNAHHFASLWPDLEPFAADGFLAITMVNTRSHIAAWGGKKKVLGTNPIAFAVPRAGAPPLIWDQASSVMSQGEILVSAAAGRPLPPGAGVDRDGAATTDPKAVLEGGALLPIAGAKGSALAFMVESLAGALTGAQLGFEADAGQRPPGAQTSNTGQLVILMSPRAMAGSGFAVRIEAVIDRLREAGSERLPSDLRYRRRAQAEREGVEIAAEIYAYLTEQAGRAARPPRS
jgi:delta1-piperideine-2-carboxylate reductase